LIRQPCITKLTEIHGILTYLKVVGIAMKSIENLIDCVETDFLLLNRLIEEQLGSEVNLVTDVSQYLLNSGGKRIRPLLTILVAKALKTDNLDHLPLAGAIECLHTATLLHDDVVDRSSMRRNNPSANAKFGNGASVLVGDFVYSRAFQLMVSVKKLDALKLLADATNQISEGEVWQLSNQNRGDLSEEEYSQVIRKKTAVLFGAAAATGAIAANAGELAIQGMYSYGEHVGIAFQLMDDWLDYLGETDLMGKERGDDLADGKCTLPLIYAIKELNDEESIFLANTLRERKREFLGKVSCLIKKAGGFEYTKKRAEQESNRAKFFLKDLPKSKYRDALIDLAGIAGERKR